MRTGLRQAAALVGEHGPGIAGRSRGVGGRVAPHDRVGALDEADELGPHEVVPRLQRGRILLGEVRALLGEPLELADPLGRQRVADQVGIDGAGPEQARIGEAREGVEHALRRLPGGRRGSAPRRNRPPAPRSAGRREGCAGSISWPPVSDAHGAGARAADPVCREVAAPTIAPAPASMPITERICAFATCCRRRARWPPAMWPVSCAMTPMISFGVSASMSAPTLMKIFWPFGHEGVEGAVVDEDDLASPRH